MASVVVPRHVKRRVSAPLSLSVWRRFVFSCVNTVFPGAVFLTMRGKRALGAVFFVSAIVATVLVCVSVSIFTVSSQGFTVLAGIAFTVPVLLAVFLLISYGVLPSFPPVRSWHKVCVNALVALLCVSLCVSGGFAGSTLLSTASALNTSIGSLSSPVSSTTPVVSHDGVDWDSKDEYINFLILGSDEGDGRRGVRPDVIMVASINPAREEVFLFNLPRNLQHAVFAPGSPGDKEFPDGFTYGEKMINWVWTWGEESSAYKGSKHPGLDATRDAVSGVLGVSIDKTLVINMQGFEKIVDSVGGVTVDVPRDLPKAKEGVPPKSWVKKGKNQKLNGEDALWFVRSRAGSSDYDRMLRARVMMSALLKKASSVEGLVHSQDMIRALGDSFRTDIQQDELDEWVELASRIKDSPVEGVAFTDKVINTVYPDFDEIHTIVEDTMNGVSAVETDSPQE